MFSAIVLSYIIGNVTLSVMKLPAAIILAMVLALIAAAVSILQKRPLIYRCKKCKHSWNLTIHERVRPHKIMPETYERFLDNDRDTALSYGNDIDFLKKNRAEFK